MQDTNEQSENETIKRYIKIRLLLKHCLILHI